jgi:hypothetical protein
MVVAEQEPAAATPTLTLAKRADMPKRWQKEVSSKRTGVGLGRKGRLGFVVFVPGPSPAAAFVDHNILDQAGSARSTYRVQSNRTEAHGAACAEGVVVAHSGDARERARGGARKGRTSVAAKQVRKAVLERVLEPHSVARAAPVMREVDKGRHVGVNADVVCEHAMGACARVVHVGGDIGRGVGVARGGSSDEADKCEEAEPVKDVHEDDVQHMEPKQAGGEFEGEAGVIVVDKALAGRRGEVQLQ